MSDLSTERLLEIGDLRAEIERLTADLDILKRHYNLHPDAPLSREETFAAKDAEVARLRAQIDQMLSAHCAYDHEMCDLEAARRRALEGKE